MFQARLTLSADLSRPLPRLLGTAQHVVPYIRPTQRHSHACFCEGPTGSFAPCYKVSRRYAGDGSLRLERRSPGMGACALSAAPPATGASSAAPLRYGISQATLACALSAAPLSLGTGPAHQAPPPRATRRAVVRLLRLHVAPFSEGVLLLHLPAMRWRSV